MPAESEKMDIKAITELEKKDGLPTESEKKEVTMYCNMDSKREDEGR